MCIGQFGIFINGDRLFLPSMDTKTGILSSDFSLKNSPRCSEFNIVFYLFPLITTKLTFGTCCASWIYPANRSCLSIILSKLGYGIYS
jgi:hypothetical protein